MRNLFLAIKFIYFMYRILLGKKIKFFYDSSVVRECNGLNCPLMLRQTQ